MTGPSRHLETAETGAFFREEFSKRGAVNTKNVPLCLCLGVLCPLSFFPSGYIYCFFTQSLFIKSLPPHLCVLFISSSSGQNRADIFHIFSPRVVPALDKRASPVPGITLSDNLITFSSLINISGDTPPPVGPRFSCRALWVRTQPDFPLGMMSFQFGCVSRERKGAEKKGKKTQLAKTELWNANWLGWNPSGEVESVSLHIFNQSGQIEGCGRESAVETGSRPKRYLNAPDSGYSQQP